MSVYRQSPFANLTPVVKNLLIINLICFLPFVVMNNDMYDNLVVKNVGEFYFNSPLFKVWQVFTYMFFHGGWTHILFNMFALFSFGPILEYSMGPKKFLNLYLICGIGAGLLQMLVQAIAVHSLTGNFTMPHFSIEDPSIPDQIKAIYYGPVIGASGAVFGVLVAFAMLYPNMELMMMFIPVPVKAKYLIIFYIGLEIYLGFGQFAGDNVAHFAHIGGAIFGFLLIKAWNLRRIQ
ncbi:rhomboid family intramembrane serine protease [Mucilaginibacter flavidus]|uniref:rhomboid family intramembrane serine protease n=1 Tax=Mucilaginibacter flavidus TaxID=2949309 RepID=UPI0020934058|nr:rhomboid family intramembrane serine protease [Mucilaginibacter flavidus]MCO5948915.1 rhomboid family intramembrane serine protease [Mucilaginibacter flavidus]